MLELRLNFSPLTVKFMQKHIINDAGKLTKKTLISNKIYQFLKPAPSNYKQPDAYNCTIYIKHSSHIFYNHKIDVRYQQFYIDESGQHTIDRFIKKYILHYWCFWCFSKQKENEKLEEKKLMEDFKNMYGFTDEDINDVALHVAYWRFKKKYKDPARFFEYYSAFIGELGKIN